MGLMSQTVSLSTRVSPQVRDRLAAAAAERGVPLATYTRTLLTSAEVPAREDGAVVREVERVFCHFGPGAGVRREAALALARTVEAGGSAGIAASKELLYQVHVAETLFEPDEDEDDPA
jgi:hypothetical protein